MTRSIPRTAAAAALLLVASVGAAETLRASTATNDESPFDASPSSSSLAPPAGLEGHLPAPPSSSSSSSRQRRLSESLPNGGCQLTWPQKPPPGIAITYAASYPGCGARMTWNLVEALTGLHTGDDWNNNGRGEEVITVKTHYPQSNGILVEFDDKIERAFIVIRNPMKSIPSFFNHIYEMRNHLPVHSERAPVEEWVKWRNAYIDVEIAEYKKFICYWMDRYPSENRLLMTYEGLTDDLIGAEVARSLNEFLGQVPGVDPIADASVPCIWRAVVKNEPPPQQAAHIKKLQDLAVNEAGKASVEAGERMAGGGGAPPPGGEGRLRRRLDPGHHDTQRKGPEQPRPYRPEDLDKMMDMLLEVAERYHREDIRLYHVMMGYYEKIRAERLRLSTEGELKKPPGGFY